MFIGTGHKNLFFISYLLTSVKAANCKISGFKVGLSSPPPKKNLFALMIALQK